MKRKFLLFFFACLFVFLLSPYFYDFVFHKKPHIDPSSIVGRKFFKPNIELKTSLERETVEKFNMAELYRREEKLLKARDFYHQALEGFIQLKSESGQAYSFLCLGIVSELLSCFSDSLVYLNKANELFKKINDLEGLSHTLRWLANRYYHEGDFQKSLEFGNVALFLAEKVKDEVLAVKIIAKIGDNLLSIGEKDEAKKKYLKSIKLSEKIDFIRGKAYGLYGLTKVYANNLAMADQLSWEALAIARQVGDRRREGRLLCTMGINAVQQKNLQQAKNFFEQSMFLYEDIHDRRGKARVMVGQAFLYKKMNNYEKSKELLDVAFQEFQSIGDFYHQYEALFYKARLLRREGKYKQAENLLKRIGELFSSLKSNVLVIKTVLELAHLKRNEGDFNESRQFYEQALSLCESKKNNELIGEAYIGFGRLDYEMSFMKSAFDNIQRGLTYAEQTDNARIQASAYLYIATLKRRMGETSEAISYAQKSKNIFSSLNSHNGFLKAQIELACIKRELGDYQDSSRILREVYQQYFSTSKDKEICSVLMNMAFINYILANYEVAEEECSKAMEISAKHNDLRGQGIVHMGRATILSRQGLVTTALDESSKALELFRKTGDKIHEVLALQNLANIDLGL